MAARVDTYALAVAELLAQLVLDGTEAAVSCPVADPSTARFSVFLAGRRFGVAVTDRSG